MPQLVSSINWAYCRSHRFSVKIQNRENRGKGSTTFWHIVDTHTQTLNILSRLCARNCHSYFKFTPASYFIFLLFSGCLLHSPLSKPWTPQVAASGKEPACQCTKRYRFDFWVGQIPWGRVRQPTRVLAWRIPWTVEPGESKSCLHIRLNSYSASFIGISLRFSHLFLKSCLSFFEFSRPEYWSG